MFQKTIKLSIDAIESSHALDELKELSEKYKKFLGIEFTSQEKDVDLDNNFCNQPSNDYNKFKLNQKDNIYHCSRRDKKKKIN